MVEDSWALGDPLTRTQVKIEIKAMALNSIEEEDEENIVSGSEVRDSWLKFYNSYLATESKSMCSLWIKWMSRTMDRCNKSVR